MNARLSECGVKGCKGFHTQTLIVGGTQLCVCDDCVDQAYELAKEFRSELSDLERKYFKLFRNLGGKDETK